MPARHRHPLPSPALVVACVALVVALSGTAIAAGIVPDARHARRADVAMRALDADRLQGKTATQIAVAGARAGAQLPGPASTAASLVSLKTAAAVPIAAGQSGAFMVSCDAGARALSAGFAADTAGTVVESEAAPTGLSTWTLRLANVDPAAAHTVTLYAVCLK
jgi:hypothetical protein